MSVTNSDENNEMQNITKENIPPRPNLPTVPLRSTQNASKVKTETRARTQTCPSTSKEITMANVSRSLKQLPRENDKKKSVANNEKPRTLKKISREYKPKPAHSGVPHPEKFKKLLQKQGDNPDVSSSLAVGTMSVTNSNQNKLIQNVAKGNTSPRPKMPRVPRSTESTSEVKTETRARTKTCPSTSKEITMANVSRSLKQLPRENDKKKSVANNEKPRTLKKISREYKPKPAHSGVPHPEKFKKLLQKQGDNPEVCSSSGVGTMSVTNSNQNKLIQNVAKGNTSPRPKMPRVPRSTESTSEVKTEKRARTNTCPSTSKEFATANVSRSLKQPPLENDKKKSVTNNEKPRTLKKISREYKPKPAHSGVPLPEKFIKFLQKQRDNPDFTFF